MKAVRAGDSTLSNNHRCRLAGLVAFSVCLVLNLTLTGCQSKEERDQQLLARFNSQRPNDWEYTSYSIDEIRTFSGRYNDFDDISSTERNSIAVRNYNIILGYIENVLNLDYKIYDLRYDTSYNAYAIDFAVLDQINHNDALSEDDKLDLEYVTITCDDEQHLIRSNVEEYMMQHKWVNDIKEEFNDKFSEVVRYYANEETGDIDMLAGRYYLNANRLSLCDELRTIKSVDYDYDNIDDYTVLLDSETYIERGYSPRMAVNVFITPGTPIEEKDEILMEIEPVLKKYCVTDLHLICPDEDCDLRSLFMEERAFGNEYSGIQYKNNGDVAWQMVYKFSLGKGSNRIGWYNS